MSTRLWMGLLLFYTFAQIICNIGEGNAMVTGTNITETQENLEHTYTTSVDTVGTPGQFVSKPIDFVSKIVFFDYNVFYDIDADTGEKTANSFVVIRYMLVAMIGIPVLVEIGLVLRKALLGG